MYLGTTIAKYTMSPQQCDVMFTMIIPSESDLIDSQILVFVVKAVKKFLGVGYLLHTISINVPKPKISTALSTIYKFDNFYKLYFNQVILEDPLYLSILDFAII